MNERSFFFDQRWCGQHGIGRFATEIRSFLPDFAPVDLRRRPLHPLDAFDLARWLRKKKAKLYLTPGFNVPFQPPCDLILTIHDLIHIHFAPEQSAGKRLYYRYLQRPAARTAKAILTVSEFSKQEIVEWYDVPHERVHVVGNGVSPAFVADGPKASRKGRYMLSVGNSKQHKNIPMLLRAFASIRDEVDCDLVLVMKPSAEILNETANLQLDGRVEFLSGVSDADLAKHYRGAVCLVLPSLYEGFGLPVIEAMASGCAVLCSSRTSLPEIAGDAGILFDPGDVRGLAELLIEAANDRLNFGELIQRGLVRASQYRWNHVGKRVEEAIGLVRRTHYDVAAAT